MVVKNLIPKISFIKVKLKSPEEKLITFVFDLIVCSKLFYQLILEDERRFTEGCNKIRIKIIYKYK